MGKRLQVILHDAEYREIQKMAYARRMSLTEWVRQALNHARRHEHLENVGTADEAFLPKVGKHGWVLITADWYQRYRPRENADLRRHKVRHFVMPGNLGATAMARLLVAAKNDIRACCRDNEPPISASVVGNGGVKLLMDAKGSLHDRGEEKFYHKGRITTRVPYRS
jgi:hypothetical protein